MSLFVAKSAKGAEFLYSRSEMYSVPKASAQRIADDLNRIGYHLKDGQTWFVHECGYGDNEYMYGKMYYNRGNLRAKRF